MNNSSIFKILVQHSEIDLTGKFLISFFIQDRRFQFLKWIFATIYKKSNVLFLSRIRDIGQIDHQEYRSNRQLVE